ncbi:MAG: hypothetical protein OXF24_06385 [Hyphomicrobiales bacterium]|nr:hypothetical protein [Hyphomicrobiales bacterium]
MTTDDMKPEMSKILQKMFKNHKGEMNIKQMEEMLKLEAQPTLYYAEELHKKGFIYPSSMDANGQIYCLTPEGRAYVMEKLSK